MGLGGAVARRGWWRVEKAGGHPLLDKVELLPERPGVYLFKDAAGEVLYVGKATSLRDRVRSYFRGPKHLAGKTIAMVQQAADLDHIITDSEVEALILECNLIKQHRPRFNVRLRDDKNYPYLRVTMREPWSRVMIARGMKDDGARYFGPFPQASAVHETLRTLRRVFPYRNCSDARFRQHRDRPCLHYFIGRCLGPCAGLTTTEAYNGMMGQLVQFLEGRQDELLEGIRRQMEEAAENLRFERAAELRDRLRALERVVEKQKIVSDRFTDQDVIGLARPAAGEAGHGAGDACVQVFFMREGKLVGRESFLLVAPPETPDGEVLAAFVKQYYTAAAFVPGQVLLPAPPEDADAIASWLAERRGGRVRLLVPRRGDRKRLVEMVQKNASLFLEEERQRRLRQAARGEGALEDLREALGLPAPPQRIECFDISNIQGRQAVGSMVVFLGGRPAKDAYRRFRVRTVPGPDDFAMMREVLSRRFRHAQEPRESREGDGRGFAELPDLLIIDGGRGQLSAAQEVLEALGLGGIPTYGLAKENEWLFGPDAPEPIVLDRDSQALYLLQRLRDEAHRFAIGYHRQIRSKESLRSLLDDVPGIGPRRRKALMSRFRTLEAIRQATVEELAAVPGMTRTAAEEVAAHLQDAGK